MRRPDPSAVSLSLGVLVLAAAGLAPLSSFSAGCANGTSAVSAGVDSGSSQPGDDDDDINQPLPVGDDDQDAATADAGDAGADSAPDSGADASPSTCAGQLAVAQYTFDTGAQGWTHGVSDGQTATDWPFDPWTQGVATAGPACPSNACFGAELTENYAECQRGYLESPVIDVSACSGHDLQLTFQHEYVFFDDGENFDGGVIFVSADGGANWHTIDTVNTFPGTISIRTQFGSYTCEAGMFDVDGKAGYTGTSGGNVSVQLTIPASLVSNQLRIKFSMGTGADIGYRDAGASREYELSGWRVDNVGLQVSPDAGTSG